MKKEKIAIVGSAIAGSVAAILLNRANFDVSVFEQRSPVGLVDRGAGIALPRSLVKKLIAMDLVDKDFATLDTEEREFIYHDPKTRENKFLGKKPFLAYAVHWGALYTNFMKRIPEDIIYYDTRVTHIQRGKKIKLTLNDERIEEFDYVIFADGYHSIGRLHLFPEAQPKFANYLAWRGTLVRVDEDTNKRLMHKVPFYPYENGHLLLFNIPALNTKNPKQEYVVNWLIYEKITDAHPLYRDNCAHQNILTNAMKPEYKRYLHDLARTYFDDYSQDIIINTKEPFTQAIYDTYVPKYHVDNMVLIGDGAILGRPHIGAGSTKAIDDAISLYEHIKDSDNIPSQLEKWDVVRHTVANDLLDLCRDLGRFLVTDMPDWNSMGPAELDLHWEDVIKGHEEWYQINFNTIK